MNEIDDIFKDAAASEKATFKPEYWDQYTTQFNGENKKRRGVFGLFLAGLVFVSGLGLVAYNNNSFDIFEKLAITGLNLDAVKVSPDEKSIRRL